MMSRLIEQSELLTSDRVWRWALVLLFILAVLPRFFVHLSLSDHPVGRLDEVPGTVPQLYRALAEEAVLREDWLLNGPNFLITQEMRALAPIQDWYSWSGLRLPRGVFGVWLAGFSFAMTNTMAVYTILGILGGAVLPVLTACGAARFFRNRRAAFLAGLITCVHMTLIIASVVIGPWLWELLILAAIVYTTLRIRDDPTNLAEWVLCGIAVALGIWMRSLFLWSVILVPAALLWWRVPIKPLFLTGMIVPMALLVGTLSVRNYHASESPLPLVGQPAWDLYSSTHPGAIQRESPPSDVLLFAAAEGSFPRTVQLMATSGEYRAALAPVMARKLRAFLGGRDVVGTFNPEYLRRRSEPLRVFSLRPDITMALGWAAFLFLLYRRKLRLGLLALLAIIIIHGVLFRSDGMERIHLHWVTAWLIAAALIEAFSSIRKLPSLPFIYLLLYAASLWLLAVDDQGKGTRYRAREFVYASSYYYRIERNLEAADMERIDYYKIKRQELLTMEYWNAIR